MHNPRTLRQVVLSDQKHNIQYNPLCRRKIAQYLLDSLFSVYELNIVLVSYRRRWPWTYPCMRNANLRCTTFTLRPSLCSFPRRSTDQLSTSPLVGTPFHRCCNHVRDNLMNSHKNSTFNSLTYVSTYTGMLPNLIYIIWDQIIKFLSFSDSIVNQVLDTSPDGNTSRIFELADISNTCNMRFSSNVSPTLLENMIQNNHNKKKLRFIINYANYNEY